MTPEVTSKNPESIVDDVGSNNDADSMMMEVGSERDTDSEMADVEQKSNNYARDEHTTNAGRSSYRIKKDFKSVIPEVMPSSQHTEQLFNPSYLSIVLSYQQHDQYVNIFPPESDVQQQRAGTKSSKSEEESETQPELLLQPETRPISYEQLAVEVKSIYAGLVTVEAKCIKIDERHSAAVKYDPIKKTNLKDDQWQSLIALHIQLLHDHYDFFLASQHPSATLALKALAAKYGMPRRMWRHGIHALLEVFRAQLPGSLEHMLAFIYIAYNMVALLYETVPAHEDTWTETLGMSRHVFVNH